MLHIEHCVNASNSNYDDEKVVMVMMMMRAVTARRISVLDVCWWAGVCVYCFKFGVFGPLAVAVSFLVAP